MTQEELNQELDHFLEEGIFNGDLDSKDVELIRHYICAMVQEVDGVIVTDEQWQNYTVHCLQTSVETAMLKSRQGGVQ